MTKSLVLALTALGGIASAQPGPQPSPPPPPADTSMTTTDQSMTTTDVAPQPEGTPQPAPQPVVAAATVDDTRPSGLSIALGIGYGLPTSLETPNRTSARLRLASGLTIEPLLSISNTRDSREMVTPMVPTMDTTDKETVFGFDVLLRLPFLGRGRVDLEGLATAGFTTVKDNDEGSYNTISTNTLAVGWGVGIGYWLSRHWQLSMSVTNPVIQYSRRRQETGPNDAHVTDSDTTLGLIFVPQVTAMIHLYN